MSIEELANGESRRLLYVKPGFQRKMMIIIVLIVIIAVNVVGVLCYLLITTTLQTELIDPSLSGLAPGQIPLLQQKHIDFRGYIYCTWNGLAHLHKLDLMLLKI